MIFRMAKIFLTSRGQIKFQKATLNPNILKSNISGTVRDREKVSMEVR